MAVNKWHGIGNLGKDPDSRFMADGKAVCNISVAISEKYKDKNGEQKEVTEWVNVVFFGKLAEIASSYLTKGSQVYVEGKLKTEKYEKDGQTRYVTKIIGEKMQMLSKSEGRPKKAPERAQSDFSDEMDAEIPF